MRLYLYQGPPDTLELANGDELQLAPGARIEVESTPKVRELVDRGLLSPLKRDSKPAKDRRRRRRLSHAQRARGG